MPTIADEGDDLTECPECHRWVASLDRRAGHKISCDYMYRLQEDDEYDEF